MRFFQNRVFTLANVASLLMFFGMFGSIFLLSQFFQIVQGYSPLGSGLRILPWTIMPIFVAPIAGALSDRIGGAPADGHRTDVAGRRARLARGDLDADHSVLASRRAVHGLGHRDGDVLGTGCERRPRRRSAGGGGQGVGRENAIRELGGVFGVAVLASVFSHYGGYSTGQSFVDGMVPALWIGAVVVFLGAVAAFLIPGRKRAAEATVDEPVAFAEAA